MCVWLQTETYAISKDCAAMDTTTHSTATRTKSTLAAHKDPTADLTFDLRLSSQEKEVRSRVVLPYTSEQQRQPISMAQPHLQLQDEEDDEEQDFDSDLDDDLDF